MSMNIKNERVHDLAREAARLTGKNKTSVIEEALQHYLLALDEQRMDRKRRIDDFLADLDASGIADRIPGNSDFLYDEQGLPA